MTEIRFFADWQILTWDEGFVVQDHMHDLFSDTNQSEVDNFAILLVAGDRGFHYVFFTGTVDVDEYETNPNTKRDIKKILDEIVHDTDVKVRWHERA